MSVKQVISKYDYGHIKAGAVCDVVETVKHDKYGDCFYKVTCGDDPAIHYLLFAEVKEL